MVKRPAKPLRISGRWRDIRRAVTPEQAAGIGYVCLAYNDMEASLNHLMMHALIGLPDPTVAAGVSGIEQKIAILKSACVRIGFDGREMEVLNQFTAPIPTLKGYRDVIVHAALVDSAHALGRQTGRGGKESNVLLTAAATNVVIDWLSTVDQNLSELLDYLAHTRPGLVGPRQDSSRPQFDKDEQLERLEHRCRTSPTGNLQSDVPFPEESEFHSILVDVPPPNKT